MIIPNSRFVENKVINWSHLDDLSRFSIKVGVAYGSDVDQVKRTLLLVADQHELVSRKMEPFVRFTDFGESSLDFELFFWTDSNFIVENIKSDLRFQINRAFQENKIVIPSPQRDLHMKNN